MPGARINFITEKGGDDTMSHNDDFLLTRDDIIRGLIRLGELAQACGLEVKFGIVGGAVMVLEYGARELTHDVDAIILAPPATWAATRAKVFELVEIVAGEFSWPEDWLNDDASQFVDELEYDNLFPIPGIEVYIASTAQMLGLKLSAWRGGVDTEDASSLLQRMSGSREEIWRAVRPFLVPGYQATAEDAFDSLWIDTYGYESDWRHN